MKLSKVGLLLRAIRLMLTFGVRPFLNVVALALIQGAVQVIGVTSILPFLAVAADPDRFWNSSVGRVVREFMPSLSTNQFLMFAGCAAIAMLLISNGVCLFGEYTRARYARRYAAWLQVRLLERILAKPYAEFTKVHTGQYQRKINTDVTQFAASVLLPIVEGIAMGVTVALLVCVLVIIDPFVALGAALVLGACYMIIYRMLKGGRKVASQGLQLAHSAAMVETQQTLSVAKAIKVALAERHFIDRFAKFANLRARYMALMPLYQKAPRYVIEPIAFGGIILVVVVSLLRGMDLRLILPNLGVMALAGYRMLPNLQSLYAQLTQIHTMGYVVDELLAEWGGDAQRLAPGLSFASPAGVSWSKKLEWDCVTFGYDAGRSNVIENFTLTINKLEAIGIVGSTGAGKSTLIDLMLGLHRPSSGRFRIDDVEVEWDRLREWQAIIGYVPQDIVLIDDSVYANIAFGVAAEMIRVEKVIECAKAAQVHDFIVTELPEGYETKVGDRGVRLSGGQRQRIALARALYHDPSVLILDEATSALDQATEANVMNAMKQLRGKITMIIVAHRLSTLSFCDKIVELGRH